MTTADSFRSLAPAARQEVAGALSSTPDSHDARSLRHAPYADRLISLQTAMIPPKVDGTSERVAEIVKGLAQQGAIYPDQMGAIHSTLLNRAHTWNSLGVQESIQALVNDVIHGQNKVLQDELGRTQEIANASMLTRFYDSIPKTVDRGQRNFEGVKKLLRLFVNNVPNSEVYSSGTSYSLQVNLGGTSQNINLTLAFDNLKDLWGARWDTENNLRIGALLTPNTRALLFFISAYYDYGVMEPGSYLDNLLRLYKEAIRPDVDSSGDAILDMKETGVNLGRKFNEYKDTLNYLLQNRQYVPPSERLDLSPEQEELLEYLMRQLRQSLKDGIPADISVAGMTQFLDPYLATVNQRFIEGLQNYLLTANARNPDFYKAIVLDPGWRPPGGMLTGEFSIPERTTRGPSNLEYLGSERDEYYDDRRFQRPPRQQIDDTVRETIDQITREIDEILGVQSEAGWITDHRLPQFFDQAISLGPPTQPDVQMRPASPIDIQMADFPSLPSSRSSSRSSSRRGSLIDASYIPLPRSRSSSIGSPAAAPAPPQAPTRARQNSGNFGVYRQTAPLSRSASAESLKELYRLIPGSQWSSSNSLSGTGGPGFFASLQPTVGTPRERQTGLALGLEGMNGRGYEAPIPSGFPQQPYWPKPAIRGSGGSNSLLRKVLDPAQRKRGKRVRFY